MTYDKRGHAYICVNKAIDEHVFSHLQTTQTCGKALIFWDLPGFIVSSLPSRQCKLMTGIEPVFVALQATAWPLCHISIKKAYLPLLVFDSWITFKSWLTLQIYQHFLIKWRSITHIFRLDFIFKCFQYLFTNAWLLDVPCQTIQRPLASPGFSSRTTPNLPSCVRQII